MVHFYHNIFTARSFFFPHNLTQQLQGCSTGCSINCYLHIGKALQMINFMCCAKGLIQWIVLFRKTMHTSSPSFQKRIIHCLNNYIISNHMKHAVLAFLNCYLLVLAFSKLNLHVDLTICLTFSYLHFFGWSRYNRIRKRLL